MRWGSAATTPASCSAASTELAFAAAPTTMRAGLRRGGDFARSKVGAWRGRDGLPAAACAAGGGFEQLALHGWAGGRPAGRTRSDYRSGLERRGGQRRLQDLDPEPGGACLD